MSDPVIRLDGNKPFATKAQAEKAMKAGNLADTYFIDVHGAGFALFLKSEHPARPPDAVAAPVAAAVAPQQVQQLLPVPAGQQFVTAAELADMRNGIMRDMKSVLTEVMKGIAPSSAPSPAAVASQPGPADTPWNSPAGTPQGMRVGNGQQPVWFEMDPVTRKPMFKLKYYWVVLHASNDQNATRYVPLIVQAGVLRLSRGVRLPLSSSHIEALMQTVYTHWRLQPGMTHKVGQEVSVYPFSIYEETTAQTFENWLSQGTDIYLQERREEQTRSAVNAVNAGFATIESMMPQ